MAPQTQDKLYSLSLFVDYEPVTLPRKLILSSEPLWGPFRRGIENLCVELQFLVPLFFETVLAILFVVGQAGRLVRNALFRLRHWVAIVLAVSATLFF